MSAVTTEKFLRVPAVAERLGVSEMQVRRMIDAGKLASVHPTEGVVAVAESELQRFIAECVQQSSRCRKQRLVEPAHVNETETAPAGAG